MRLIDADRLETHEQLEPFGNGKYEYVEVVYKDDIDDAPTIEERKKGKWIHDGFDFPHGVDWAHCSVCGRKGINAPADLTNFCPNCGADMRGKQE